MGLLAELLELACARPGINPAMLVEHFAERPEYAALQKLMAASSVGQLESNLGAIDVALPKELTQAINAIHDANPNPK